MSSSRLPGKVLLPLAGRPMMLRQIERVRRSRRLTRLMVATSQEASDDGLAELCAREGLEVVRGPLDDVLSRYWAALEQAGRPEHFIRLTADCPLADPDVLDRCVDAHLAEAADFTANTSGRTFPVGLDVEVCRTSALEAAFHEAADPFEREHVMPFLYRRPERFRLAEVRREPALRRRWTVDTEADYRFAAAVYAALYPAKPRFTSDDVQAWQDRADGPAGRPAGEAR